MNIYAQDNPLDSNKYIGPQNGYLIIVGGGSTPRAARDRFIQLAGNTAASIVFIPTAGSDDSIPTLSDRFIAAYKKRGITNITVLHTRDKKTANDSNFYNPLKTATGVFIGGGKQGRLSDAYLGTKTVDALYELLNRGGVIEGSSAGATIQGSFLMNGGTRKGNSAKIANAYNKGFGFVKHTAIDQHLLKRNRQLNLVPVIKEFPDLLGIGIDESSAIEIHKNTLTVSGNSKVFIYDNKNWQKQTKETGGLTIPYISLTPNQSYDLLNRKVVE